ncbi:MAG: DoxX family protein [Opitutales bacterium]
MQTPAYSKDLGLLILRVGIGVMFIFHGLPKLLGGPGLWEGLAQKGLPFLPEGLIAIAFGFAAMAAELGGGLLLALGKYHRIVCLALAVTMAVAFTTKIGGVTGLSNFAHVAGWPLELLIVFVALFFTGPGRYKLGQ